MAKRVSDEQIARMRELREEGLSYRAIGREIGCSSTTAFYWLDCEFRQMHIDKRRKYREEHHEEELESNRKYREENREATRERYRKWYEKNKGTPREVCRARDTAARRRARKRKATVGDKEKIRAIYAMACSSKPIRCYICGELIHTGERHVDHIHPLSKGGKHTPSNLAIACKSCNLSKSDKMPSELGLLC